MRHENVYWNGIKILRLYILFQFSPIGAENSQSMCTISSNLVKQAIILKPTHGWDRTLYYSSLISCEFAVYMNPIHSSWLLKCWKWDTFPGFPILSTAEQILIRYSPLSHKESSFLWRLSMANLSLNVNILRWMHLQINRSIEIDSEKISWYWNSSGKQGQNPQLLFLSK